MKDEVIGYGYGCFSMLSKLFDRYFCMILMYLDEGIGINVSF